MSRGFTNYSVHGETGVGRGCTQLHIWEPRKNLYVLCYCFFLKYVFHVLCDCFVFFIIFVDKWLVVMGSICLPIGVAFGCLAGDYTGNG